MMNITDLKQAFQSTELLSINDSTLILGGAKRDDKRRQRPGGGTTTTSPNLRDGGSHGYRNRFSFYENSEKAVAVTAP
jgi:hypothetical protein